MNKFEQKKIENILTSLVDIHKNKNVNVLLN